jgi:peptidoglycan/LPS O-acetylase OafA/YrhL
MFANWLGGRAPWQLSKAGFFGVELFFVLSGFLIGRLLINIITVQPTLLAWLVFMTRRWMRTLPIYFILIGVLAVIWPPHFWEPNHWPLLLHVLPPFLTLTQNLAWPMTYDWFGVSWSLTVEEWFYLGFSAMLLSTVALLGRTAAFWTTVLFFLAVPNILRWHVPLSADFNRDIAGIAVMRLDAIAFGVALAWLLPRLAFISRFRWVAFGLGALMIAGLWSEWIEQQPGLDQRAWRTVIFDLTSIGFALCLPAAADLRRPPKILGPIVLAISTQSYAIYIMHLSVLEIVGSYIHTRNLPPVAAIVLSLVLIWGLSLASWRWIEGPIMRHRPAQPGRQHAQGAPSFGETFRPT